MKTANRQNLGINPLSNPKGIKRLCELCEKPAYLQCLKCRVTYYCDKDHQTTDFKGIHEKICSSLIPLRNQQPILGSEEERREQKVKVIHQKVYLI
jgi:hypothetical protein